MIIGVLKKNTIQRTKKRRSRITDPALPKPQECPQYHQSLQAGITVTVHLTYRSRMHFELNALSL